MTAQERLVESESLLPQRGQFSNVLAEKPTQAGRFKRLVSGWSWVGTFCRRMLSTLRRGWRQFLAVTRLNSKAICEESAGLGCYDYHTYADDVDGAPWFIEGGARGKGCDKKFRL